MSIPPGWAIVFLSLTITISGCNSISVAKLDEDHRFVLDFDARALGFRITYSPIRIYPPIEGMYHHVAKRSS